MRQRARILAERRLSCKPNSKFVLDFNVSGSNIEVNIYYIRFRLMNRTTLIASLIALVLTTSLTLILYARVAIPDEATASKPLPVAATTYVVQQSYERESSYLGLVQAGRKTVLGFELPGLLKELKVQEGSAIAAGDIIASLDEAKLQSRRNTIVADLKRVNIDLELARIKARRQRNLSNTGAVSKEAYDETRLVAQALLAQVDSVQAQLDSIDIDLQKSVLRAPYTGVIADRYLDEGAVVSPGTPVVKLMETERREAHIGVAVEHIKLLVPGSQHQLQLRHVAVRATLLSVRPDVDPVTRTATAVFALPDEVFALDGEPITLELAQAVYMEGGWLPIAALMEGQRGVWSVLQIVSQDGVHRTVREAVEVLEVQGDMAYVYGTLIDGALIVAQGTHRVTPGVSVTVLGQ
jgi:RND family efflux transporter MFP subunit